MSQGVSSETKNYPDFLCIGMQKAGTGWLYDTLLQSSGVCSQPIKEFHHFNYRLSEMGTTLSERRKRLYQGFRKYGPNLSDHDSVLQYQERLNDYLEAGCTDDANLNLFSTPVGQVAGDFTPAYSMLDSAAVGDLSPVSSSSLR